MMIRNLIGKTAERFGYHIVNWRANYPAEDCQLLDQVRPHTMVRPLRLLAICDAVAYIARNSIPGDWVECGVWKGGCSLLAELKMKQVGDRRPIWMYDMAPAGAKELLQSAQFIEGDVLTTIPDHAPESIAILRLDTNSYASTFHELTHLYPLLSKGGVLLLDDWKIPEFRSAVIDYFQGNRPFIARSDYTGATIIKR